MQRCARAYLESWWPSPWPVAEPVPLAEPVTVAGTVTVAEPVAGRLCPIQCSVCSSHNFASCPTIVEHLRTDPQLDEDDGHLYHEYGCLLTQASSAPTTLPTGDWAFLEAPIISPPSGPVRLCSSVIDAGIGRGRGHFFASADVRAERSVESSR